MVKLEVKKAGLDWNLFDVTLTGPDVVATRRFNRMVLTVLLKEFKRTGKIQIGNLEATVPSATDRAHMLEMAEAEMREEIP